MSRPVVVCVRLTEAEAAKVDAMRRGLTRTHWLRWLVVHEINREQK